MGQLFEELKRRNVLRVAAAYVVVSWLIIQVVETIFPAFGFGDAAIRNVTIVLAIGLIPALILSWAFEITPEGLKKEKDVDRSQSVTAQTGKKLDRWIMVVLVFALVYFAFDKFALSPEREAAQLASATEEARQEGRSQALTESYGEKSIAVLPFVNLSSDEEQEWFVDGLTEEILNSLARTPDLLVAARTSSFSYKGTSEDVRKIADELGVAHILEGSVRKSVDILRVTAQLIRASDGFHLWSETYDRPLADVIAIQEEIALQIANALETAMDPEALAAMVSAGTRSVPAYEAYLRGNGHFENRNSGGDADEMLAAFSEWETAIELDPGFALAYGRIEEFWFGQLLGFDYVFNLSTDLSRVELEERWNAAIDAAIKHESNPVSNLYYQTRKARGDLNFRQALRIIEKYLDQRPNDMAAYADRLDLMRMLSIYDQVESLAIEVMNRDERRELPLNVLIQNLRPSQNKELIREFVRYSIGQQGEDLGVLYQAHRGLLFADDIIGAGELLALIRTSSLPKSNIVLATIRQACAENRTSDAIRLLNEDLLPVSNTMSSKWLGYTIIGDDTSALEVAMEYDEQGEVLRLASLLQYHWFDPRPFPNLMSRLVDQRIEDRMVVDIPYRCDR